jgi:SulP family sulfate permease
MGEWRDFRELRRYTFNYRAVLLSAFVLTVVLDLTVAVEAGMVLAALFFITRISGLTRITELPAPAGIAARVYSVYGSLFFGSANKIESLLAHADPADPARVLILDLQKTINVDTTGLDMLDILHRKLVKNGKMLIIAGANEQPRSLFERSGFAARLGAANVVTELAAAHARAAECV